MKRRIAILAHEKSEGSPVNRYMISQLAGFWREDGHDVSWVYGCRKFDPADLVIVHVDRSVVPDEYLEFATRWPIALNGRVRDIRKSTFSGNLLRRGDAYDGPVIVKTDLNHGGVPERQGLWARLKSIGASIRGPGDYRVYDRLADVPPDYFNDPALIVQKLECERDGDLYCLRLQCFLGRRSTCIRMKGRSPVLRGESDTSIERVEPHPSVESLRRDMNFDFGKFDYVVRNGEPVVLDVNKTVGGSPRLTAYPEVRAMQQYLAEGLYEYFT